jgi:hypothetical protein
MWVAEDGERVGSQSMTRVIVDVDDGQDTSPHAAPGAENRPGWVTPGSAIARHYCPMWPATL